MPPSPAVADTRVLFASRLLRMFAYGMLGVVLVPVLVPLMPTLPLAIVCLLTRHLLSQMDVPTRASYLSAVVTPSERAAANGATSTAKQLGTALGPLIAGKLFGAAAVTGLPFFICGVLKSSYDLMLWRAFRSTKPPEEK